MVHQYHLRGELLCIRLGDLPMQEAAALLERGATSLGPGGVQVHGGTAGRELRKKDPGTRGRYYIQL